MRVRRGSAAHPEETLELRYTNRHGGSTTRYFARRTLPAQVEEQFMRRWRAREESTLLLDNEPIGEVTKLDGRWTWWLDAEAIQDWSRRQLEERVSA